ncbi:hypothetical protein RUM43_005105 [Polyplax serrata]|uniref:Uncharacterized protein n=1 Tax=Polyplax serrata TaxID=468196 RepID=A0AAN8SF44_POLSC
MISTNSGITKKLDESGAQPGLVERWNKAKEDQVRNKRRLDYDDDDDDDASSTSGRRRTRFSAFILFNCFRGRMDEKIRLGKERERERKAQGGEVQIMDGVYVEHVMFDSFSSAVL